MGLKIEFVLFFFNFFLRTPWWFFKFQNFKIRWKPLWINLMKIFNYFCKRLSSIRDKIDHQDIVIISLENRWSFRKIGFYCLSLNFRNKQIHIKNELFPASKKFFIPSLSPPFSPFITLLNFLVFFRCIYACTIFVKTPDEVRILNYFSTSALL